VDLATLDLSFISLRLVLGPVRAGLAADGEVVALVKPQFEAGKADVPRGGVVRDPAVHRRVLLQLATDAAAAGFWTVGLVASPRTGREGNREFLAYLQPVDGRAGHAGSGVGAWDEIVDRALD
jgi:23S rRNA (cytidine1920-2'-O)/16S rRNA (cytidine1409-2'-O)-methyltransferase